MVIGHEPEQQLLGRCINYLGSLLIEHGEFIQEIDSLKQRFPAQVQIEWSDIQFSCSIADPMPEEEEEVDKVKKYHRELERVNNLFGLNPTWGLEAIHNAAQGKSVLGPAYAWSDYPREYTIRWRPYDFRTIKEAEQHVLKQFRQQLSQEEPHLLEASLVRKRAMPQLQKHIRWVFLKVSLRYSWNKIAQSEFTNIDHVRKAVEPLVALLGLSPPKIKGGRPRKQH